MNQQLPVVYYSNETFLIFKAEHALQLRRNRILSEPVSNFVPTGLQSVSVPPYSLSLYAAFIVAELHLAEFRRLELKDEISLLDNKSKWDKRLLGFIESARDTFVNQRKAELRKRNISLESERDFLKEFDEEKVRLTLSETIDQEWSSYNERVMNLDSVKLKIRERLQMRKENNYGLNKLQVYHDLYKRGFYISSGMKFGGHFLAYNGDPIGYHSQYVIKVVDSDEQGLVDLSKTNIHQINSLQRLTHTVNKVPLFTTIKLVEGSSRVRVTYWTLDERVYLNSNSMSTDFKLIEPSTSKACARGNKVRRGEE